MMDFFETVGMRRMFERIAKTFADGRASEVLVNFGLNADRKSYSNAAGEFLLSQCFVEDVFSLKNTDDGIEYSEFQPVSQYFLQQLQLYSATQQAQQLSLEAMPNDTSVFIVRTNRPENRPFLPILYCLGMLIGCPYAGYLSSKVWVFRKEMLYLCAKAFGMLNINVARLLTNLMIEDIQVHSKRHKIFCKPLWRVLMSVERCYKEPECLSHVPRTAVTVVEMSRFAEIVQRHMPLKDFRTAEILGEQARIMRTYESKQSIHPSNNWIKAILMYERRLLIENMPQFVPRLKWIHARKTERERNDKNTMEVGSETLTQQPD